MKNKLMIYHGGGYDGCFWEFNLCCWDAEEKWHDIFSSGSAGIKNVEDAIECVKNNTHEHRIFDILKPKQMEEFSEKYNVGLVYGTLKYFNEHDIESRLALKCSMCECEHSYYEDFHLEGLHGDGGIHQSYSELICSNCYSSFSCDNCSEFYKEADNKDQKVLVTSHTGERYCENCLRSNIEHSRSRLQEVIRQYNKVPDKLMLDTAIRERMLIEKYLDDQEFFENKEMADGR